MARRRRNKKIHQEYTNALVHNLSHELRGITTIEGKTTFLFGALKDEVVNFKYTQCRSQFDEGIVTEVVQASPDRVKPNCEHFGLCGGCRLQHMKHETQVIEKEHAFFELLIHQAQAKPTQKLPAITDAAWGYRTKARLSVRFVPKKEKVLVGFREQNGRYVADITHCPILHPSIGKKIKQISEQLITLEKKDEIPQIEVAVGEDHSALIIRHLSAMSDDDKNQLIHFAKENNLWLYLQPKGPDSIHKIYPNDHQDLLYYDLPDDQLRLYFHPTEFTQINVGINRKMIKQAIELLNIQKEDSVLDLFCGIGNFSLPLALKAKSVTGVEGSEIAVARAKENATHNKLTNCAFHTYDLTQDCTKTLWAQQKYQKLLLDPARSGAKEVLQHINLWEPERIVYVSCNPMTLARDTKYLLELGYTLESAGVMDMFPHTQHIEAMALFVRKKHESHR